MSAADHVATFEWPVLHLSGWKSVKLVKAFIEVSRASKPYPISHFGGGERSLPEQTHAELKPVLTYELTCRLSGGNLKLAMQLRATHADTLRKIFNAELLVREICV
jgi:hypothetical protein